MAVGSRRSPCGWSKVSCNGVGMLSITSCLHDIVARRELGLVWARGREERPLPCGAVTWLVLVLEGSGAVIEASVGCMMLSPGMSWVWCGPGVVGCRVVVGGR